VISESTCDPEVFRNASKLTLESSLVITGTVVKDERQLGGFELQATSLTVIQQAEEYPIAKKEHGVDFLRDNRHLWLRSKRQWAIMRIRNRITFSIHEFFQSRNFIQGDAPIFTGNAVEGTTTLFETDFYGQPAYLSQSGQLYGEALAMAHGRIYTFGPTFRAEKSRTRRHLSEFWMIEPEMAFFDLEMNMDLIEDFIRHVVKSVLEHCRQELEVIERDSSKLQLIATTRFPRLHYDDAVRIMRGEQDVEGRNSIRTLEHDLQQVKEQMAAAQAEIADREAKIQSGNLKKGEVNFNRNRVDVLRNQLKELAALEENIPQWLASVSKFEHGSDFGGADETVLTRLFDVPIMVYNWPKEVKAFYMKRDEKDDRYVKGVDVLAPEGFGEIVGGAERETDLELLRQRIEEHKLPMQAFEWYLDLRRFGSVPHAGFGLGLERLVAWICKLDHIRETIPFARMYGRLFP
jgi:asparaginyl-tRNA synthetase